MPALKRHLGWLVAIVAILGVLGYFGQMFYFRGPEFNLFGDRLALDITVANRTLLLADAKLGLQTFSLDNPEQPKVLTTYKVPGRDGYKQMQVSADGKTVFLASAQGTFGAPGYEGWLDIVNIENPRSPTLVSSLRINGNITGQGVFEGINYFALQGHFLFLTDNGGNFEVIDVSNISSPKKIAELDATATSSMRDVVVKENYAYVDFVENTNTDGHRSTTFGVRLINIHNPEKPEIFKDFQTVTSVLTLVQDQYLALVDGNLAEPKLVIVDISSADQPKIISKTTIARGSTKAYFSQGTLYIPYNVNYDLIAGEKKVSGVVGYDISHPEHPVLKSKFRTRGFAMKVTSLGSRLYVADGILGLAEKKI